MANETTYTTGTSLIDAEYIKREVGAAVLDQTAIFPLCDLVDIGSAPTRVVSFATAPAISLTTKTYDNSAVSNAAWTPTDVTATVAEYGWKTVITDMLKGSSVVDPMSVIVREASAALIDKADNLACALFSGFSHYSNNSTNTDATPLLALASVRTLMINFKRTDGALFVLHPYAWYQIQAAMQAGSGAALSTVYSRQDLIQLNKGVAGAYRGDLYGFPVLVTNNVPSTGSNVDWCNAFLIPSEAIGVAVKWLPKVEFGRDLSNGINGDAVLVTMAVGVVEKRDDAGVLFMSDAD